MYSCGDALYIMKAVSSVVLFTWSKNFHYLRECSMIPFNHLGLVFKHFGSVIYPKKVLEELCVFLKPFSNNESILDVGAGTGVMSEFAYSCNSELKYIAVDPAEGMLKYTPAYVKTYIAKAEKLPFENNSIDAVLMGESLHHLDNPNLALKEIVRVLKRNGKLFIYDFDLNTFRGKIGRAHV